MANKYLDYEEKLRPCHCGGKVTLSGGTYGYPTFKIECSRCSGIWNMGTYSPEEALKKWGEKIS